MFFHGERLGAHSMYMYIGADVLVDGSKVVAILNMDCVERSRETKSFMESNEKEGKVVDVSGGEPKAVVVTADEVYLCPVSVGTLRKRISGTFDSGGDE